MIEKSRLGRDFHLSIIKTDLHLAGSKFLFLYEGLQNLTQYCASFNSVPDKGWIFGRGLFLCPLFSFYNFFVSKDKTLKLQKCQKTYLGIFL